jgi:hypothetical protein
VIEPQRHAEVVARGNASIHHAWLRSNAAQRYIERVVVEGNRPTATFPNIPTAVRPTRR